MFVAFLKSVFIHYRYKFHSGNEFRYKFSDNAIYYSQDKLEMTFEWSFVKSFTIFDDFCLLEPWNGSTYWLPAAALGDEVTEFIARRVEDAGRMVIRNT